VRHSGPLGLALHAVSRGPLGAHEQDAAAVGDHLANEFRCLVVEGQGLLEIDNVYLVALAKDERSHLRIPETGLVPKVHPRLQHLAHGNVCHVVTSG